MLGPDLNDLCDGEGVDGLEALLLGLNRELGALLEKSKKGVFFQLRLWSNFYDTSKLCGDLNIFCITCSQFRTTYHKKKVFVEHQQ